MRGLTYKLNIPMRSNFNDALVKDQIGNLCLLSQLYLSTLSSGMHTQFSIFQPATFSPLLFAWAATWLTEAFENLTPGTFGEQAGLPAVQNIYLGLQISREDSEKG